MKTKLVILLILLFTALGGTWGGLHAQDPELFQHTWYLHNITISGQTTTAPKSPEMVIQAFFNNNEMLNDMCCAGALDIDLNFDANQTSFEITDLTLVSGNCGQAANNNFSNLYGAFYQNAVNDPFTYTVVSQQWYKILTITNDDGDEIKFYNTPHTLPLDDIFNTFPPIWYLSSMSINGQNPIPVPTNQEFSPITIEFFPDGTFTTSVCSTLTGQITFINGEFCHINCNFMVQSSNVCLHPDNSDIEALYMSFFTANANDVWTYYLSIVDPFESDGYYTLDIFAPSGDNLYFLDSPTLSSVDFTKQLFNIYPNPTSGIVNIDIPGGADASGIRLMDMQGKTLLQNQSVNQGLDLSDFAAGVYFVEITMPQGKMVRKLIKR